jgi:hypothetical protein
LKAVSLGRISVSLGEKPAASSLCRTGYKIPEPR